MTASDDVDAMTNRDDQTVTPIWSLVGSGPNQLVVECAPVACSACTVQMPPTLHAGEYSFAWLHVVDAAGSKLAPFVLADGLSVSLYRSSSAADGEEDAMAPMSMAPTAQSSRWQEGRTQVLTLDAALALFHSTRAWQPHHPPTAPHAACVALRSLDAGPHALHVALRGVPLGGSPFALQVLPCLCSKCSRVELECAGGVEVLHIYQLVLPCLCLACAVSALE